jgi:hypothetical protein
MRMSNIIKIDELSPALSESEKKVVLAEQSERIRNVEPVDLANELINYLNEAYVILGHSKKVTDQEVTVMAKLIIDKLQEKYPNYRSSEIWNAIRNGAFGEYDDEVVYISARNVIRWCVKYQSNKSEALLKQMKHKARLTEAQKEAQRKEKRKEYWEGLANEVEKDFNLLQENKPLGVNAWLYYTSLDELGLIDVPTEEKKELFEKTFEDLKQKSKEKFERIETGTIKSQAQNLCREHFYTLFLWNIEDFEQVRERINKRIAEKELF